MTASIDGPALQRVYSLTRPFVLVGSSPNCDIVIPLRDIPPVALCLLMTYHAAHWIDLASPFGQWRSGPFDQSGCLVWRGYHLDLQRIRDETDLAATSGSLTDGGSDSDGRLEEVPTFDVAFDGERLARAKLTHTLTLVGQSERCRLRLRNRHVALDHCLLYVAGRRVWMIDLLSDKGTYLRGRRVAAGEVHAGDVVTVGKPHLTMLRWSRRSTRAGSSSDILIGAPVHDDATRAIVLDTCDTAEASEGLAPSSTDRSADSLRDTAFEIELLRATIAEIKPPAQVPATAVAAASDQSPEPRAAPEQELKNWAIESYPSDLPLPAAETASEVQPRDAANPAGEPTTGLSADDSLPADSEPVVLHPRSGLAPASAGYPTVDLDAIEAKHEAAVMPPLHPLAHSRVLASPTPESPAAESLAANQALDRLIVRHRYQHRKRTLIWTAVGSIVVAAFLAGVHWATENVNFHAPAFDFNLETLPPESTESESATAGFPSSQRSAGDSRFELERPGIPIEVGR